MELILVIGANTSTKFGYHPCFMLIPLAKVHSISLCPIPLVVDTAFNTDPLFDVTDIVFSGQICHFGTNIEVEINYHQENNRKIRKV
jgi:hypothetical protein